VIIAGGTSKGIIEVGRAGGSVRGDAIVSTRLSALAGWAGSVSARCHGSPGTFREAGSLLRLPSFSPCERTMCRAKNATPSHTRGQGPSDAPGGRGLVERGPRGTSRGGPPLRASRAARRRCRESTPL